MTPFTPDYAIINKTNGQNITEQLKPWMIRLTLQESADNHNDTLSLSMNGQGINQFPPSGTVLEVQLGYKETGLVSFGHYKVDTKTLTGMPLVLNIKAGQTDFNAPIKTQKTRHFDNKTLGDVLATIAKENELEIAALSKPIADSVIPYLRQNQESDMNLIRRLAKEYSADGTVKSGKLVFKEKQQPAIVKTIHPSDLIDFRLNWIDKPKYDRVIATWHDRDTATAHEATYDGTAFVTDKTGLIARVTEKSNSQTEAKKRAASYWHTLHQLQLSATLNMTGNPTITSKTGLKLQGFTPDTDGIIIYVESVTHTIDAGYKTTLRATNQAKAA